MRRKAKNDDKHSCIDTSVVFENGSTVDLYGQQNADDDDDDVEKCDDEFLSSLDASALDDLTGTSSSRRNRSLQHK